jgi:hypothetical protein
MRETVWQSVTEYTNYDKNVWQPIKQFNEKVWKSLGKSKNLKTNY